MADNDSPERIAADILIAMMSSPGSTQGSQNLTKPESACSAYKEIFRAVHKARVIDQED